MPQLQKIAQGTPPSGVDGDTVRAAFAKVNANSDVLSACVALGYNILSDNWTLAPTNVGTRFGLVMGVGGKVVKLPLASSVSVNACIHFFNLSNPVTIGLQGNDGTQVPVLNRGDWATYASDGGGYWHVVERGKMLPDEVVSGDLAVIGKAVATNASNMLVNSTGELGNTGWNGTTFGALAGVNGEGAIFINASAVNTGTWVVDASGDIVCGPGIPVAISAEISTIGLNAGQAYVKCEAFKADGTYIGNVTSTPPISTKGYYIIQKGAGTTPAGTAFLRVSKVADNAPNISAFGVSFRRIKLERGNSPSLYSQEATIAYLAGAPAFSGRPTFGGNIPWDSSNLPRPVQHTDIGAIAAGGGDERDLSISDEVRLVLSFTPKANSVLANASLCINVGNSAPIANDFVCYLDVLDVSANVVVARGTSNIVSVPNGQLYVGISSAASLSCAVAHGGLTIGKQYQVRLHVWKVQPTGPIYPRGMGINGVVV
ncbi:hypothetical protein [Burkholderia pseudomallei]|uniref:hypothetical protein n=1 Tax=Burkholderia pseudomallei TaxID=28450 RepID=UPI0019D6EB1D|nr:hypothetical protein [Burkholderia pseudomallei]